MAGTPTAATRVAQAHLESTFDCNVPKAAHVANFLIVSPSSSRWIAAATGAAAVRARSQRMRVLLCAHGGHIRRSSHRAHARTHTSRHSVELARRVHKQRDAEFAFYSDRLHRTVEPLLLPCSEEQISACRGG